MLSSQDARDLALARKAPRMAAPSRGKAALIDQARHVASLVEAAGDDLDRLCHACAAAERVVGEIERRIRAVVDVEDRAT